MKYERGSFIVVPSREKLRGMPVPAQALYMWLCAYANEDGECFPSRETLARDCDCSKDTVDRMTKLLIDRELLKVEKRTKNGENMTNLYSVIIWGGGRTDRPPSRTGEPRVAAQSDKELYPVLTQPTQRVASDEIQETKKKPDEDSEVPEPVIPSPYSVELTRERWRAGERRLQILEWYLTEKGLWKTATTRLKLKAIMARHNKAAVRLAKADWEKGELKKAKDKALFNQQMEDEWTLDTIEKYLTK